MIILELLLLVVLWSIAFYGVYQLIRQTWANLKRRKRLSSPATRRVRPFEPKHGIDSRLLRRARSSRRK